jgi:hypothetical protein
MSENAEILAWAKERAKKQVSKTPLLLEKPSEIQPCPFCGSRSASLNFWLPRRVKCGNCHAEGPAADKKRPPESTNQWNTRASAEAVERWNTRV